MRLFSISQARRRGFLFVAGASVAICGAVLMSCSSFPAPSSGSDTALVILVQFYESSGENTFGHFRLRIVNNTDETETRLDLYATTRYGFLHGLPPGSYTIVESAFLYDSGGTGGISKPNMSFTLPPGSVTILDSVFTISIEKSQTGTSSTMRGRFTTLVDADRNALLATLSREGSFASWKTAVAGAQTASAARQQAVPDDEGVGLKDVTLDDVFPVFRTFYATHPLGKVTLTNRLSKPVTNVKVTFQIKEFMTDPTDCYPPWGLNAGESKSVDLYALLLPSILDTTENTKAQGRIDVEYTVDGRVQHQSVVQTVNILRRNATSWLDDRRAAAFVTASDPAVLLFSRNVNSFVKQKASGDFNQNLLTALAIFETLQLYGLTYSADPIPTVTRNNQVADYIEFPRQTLQYKGGKCSDFSVLYAALLESVGIETAFITIPGHIFVAFSTGLTPDEAGRSFSRPDDLIARSGKSWIPVEVTETAGFLQAWEDGAREWKESLSGRQAAFYPLRDAWKLYGPIGLPGTDVTLELPDPEKIVQKYREEVDRFAIREISSRVAELQSQIEKAPDPRRPRNALGVLYARYGKLDLARQEFEKLVAQEEYAPALMNLGNIFYLDGQKEKALEYYSRAYAKDPENPGAVLALAKANDALGQFDRAKQLSAVLKEKDPALAQRFAYLGTGSAEGTRAADVSDAGSTVIWNE